MNNVSTGLRSVETPALICKKDIQVWRFKVP